MHAPLFTLISHTKPYPHLPSSTTSTLSTYLTPHLFTCTTLFIDLPSPAFHIAHLSLHQLSLLSTHLILESALLTHLTYIMSSQLPSPFSACVPLTSPHIHIPICCISLSSSPISLCRIASIPLLTPPLSVHLPLTSPHITAFSLHLYPPTTHPHINSIHTPHHITSIHLPSHHIASIHPTLPTHISSICLPLITSPLNLPHHIASIQLFPSSHHLCPPTSPSSCHLYPPTSPHTTSLSTYLPLLMSPLSTRLLSSPLSSYLPLLT